MAVTNFSPLLGLALPTTGDLSGTWGTVVNDAITDLIDSAVAGTTTLSANADVTLTTTNGAANQARAAVILWTASNGATTRNITAPAQSKAYIVINAGTGSIVVRGAGPTAGVTVVSGSKALVAWNGSDFVIVAGGLINLTSGVTGVLPTANGGINTSNGALTSCTVDGTNAVGYLTIPINSQSTDYTLVLGDSGKSIFHPSTDTNNRTFTIPANGSVAFPIGTAVSFLNMANTVTIAITTDTMYLSGAGNTGSRTLAEYGAATAVKMTSTTWMISGSGLT
jgi:hypothetical protein